MKDEPYDELSIMKTEPIDDIEYKFDPELVKNEIIEPPEITYPNLPNTSTQLRVPKVEQAEIGISPSPKPVMLFPVKLSQPGPSTRPVKRIPKVIGPLVSQGNFRMKTQLQFNQRKRPSNGDYRSGKDERIIPKRIDKAMVEKTLEELDREYEEDCKNKVEEARLLNLRSQPGPSKCPVKIIPKVTAPLVSQGNFKMRTQLIFNQGKKPSNGDNCSDKDERIVPKMIDKTTVEEALKELDREYEEECKNKVKEAKLSGLLNVRTECIRKFQINPHPSPKEVLRLAEQFSVKYRLIYENFEKLRARHKIKCHPEDSCNRIQKYFEERSHKSQYFRLTPEQRRILDKETNKWLENSLKLSIGHIHVLADATGLPVNVIRTQAYALRKRFVTTSDYSEMQKKQFSMKEAFDEDPFPNPKTYQTIATQLEMKYEDVQRFFNQERLKYVNTNGAYDDMEHDIDEKTSNAIWAAARQGKHQSFEKRINLAKELSISNTTCSFWLDNYQCQLRWGFEPVKSNINPASVPVENLQETKPKFN